MSKKVAFGSKPTSKNPSIPADAWVENRVLLEEKEILKRLTIDIPESLHRAIKSQCAIRGTKIADEIRAMLTEKYGNQ